MTQARFAKLRGRWPIERGALFGISVRPSSLGAKVHSDRFASKMNPTRFRGCSPVVPE